MFLPVPTARPQGIRPAPRAGGKVARRDRRLDRAPVKLLLKIPPVSTRLRLDHILARMEPSRGTR